jgi:hypothetical protein
MNGAMQEAMTVAIRSISLACWICGKTVDIKDCVTDEHGRSVHEPCYVTRLALESATRKRPRSDGGVAGFPDSLMRRRPLR